MDPSIVIVVPTLNSFLDLPCLCNSLIEQTYSNWRVVFIDGPSSQPHRIWLDDFCSLNPKFSWIHQDSSSPGIFGAMNQGFTYSAPDQWLFFWGSDDWAPNKYVLSNLIDSLSHSKYSPDLIVCNGRYADSSSAKLGRRAFFKSSGLYDSLDFRRALFWGLTPPHQATLFGPRAVAKLSTYSASFRLSADLDYFLKLSQCQDLSVLCLDIDIVHMGEAGVSGQQTQRRLREVRSAYQASFGRLWLFPFIARYIRRFISFITSFL